ncbi:arylsulfatase B-like isoform X2 [Periplaneta americana]
MGMQGIPIGGSEPRGLPPARLLPEHLKDLGYTTRMVGKWHLGFYRKELTPTYRGFDSFLGYMNGLISYYDHIYQDLIPLKPIKESLASNRATSGKAPAISFEGGQLSGLDFFRNLTPAWDLSGRYATDVFTEEAVRIITTHDTAQPLFLYLSHLACHAGNRGKLLEAPQEVIDRFPHIIEPNRKTFAAMMWKLDESVGKVVAALRDRDMLQNSVILFISDNGAPTLPVGAWPNWGSNYPLRGLKLTQWEGGVRGVGALWSAGLGTPRVSSQLVHVTDWLPTLYRAAGGDPERLQKLDGVDQWNALLHDKPSKRSDALLYVDEMRKVWGVRSDRWKLVGGSNQGGMFDGYSGEIGLSPKSPAYDDTAVLRSDVAKALSAVKSTMDAASLQQLRSKATVKCPEQVNRTVCDLVKNPEPCLFDIDTDPCEANNLAESHPQEVSRLTKLYEALTVNLVPQLNAPYDVVNADPARFGNAWLPWEGTCDRDCNDI